MQQTITETIAKIMEDAKDALEKTDSMAALEALRVKLQGRKGSVTQLLKTMEQLSPEDRPAFGALVNEARERIGEAIDLRKKILANLEMTMRLKREAIDVTEPRKARRLGTLHPITLAREQMVSIFTGMGFQVAEGPEIELDTYNFEMLNLPKNHPARDAQDTFYIDDNTVLRTHTSPVQVRTMLSQKPPIRIICPGRVFRADEFDATHSPNFYQIEGLVIDEGIAMSDLKGTLDAFARRFFGEGVTTRFRPSFFPFTEPSAEVDVTCMACLGAGCRVCKGTGFLELLGSGMVNPKVFELCGIDAEKYSGFAFGMGIERAAMLKYGITDLRLLYEGDLRFLSQFDQGGCL